MKTHEVSKFLLLQVEDGWMNVENVKNIYKILKMKEKSSKPFNIPNFILRLE